MNMEGSDLWEKSFREILYEIRQATRLDLENKTVFELQASLTEEVGELSKAMQIEERVFGNADAPLPDDPAYLEAIDVVICGYAMFFALGGQAALAPGLMSLKLAKWVKRQNAAVVG